MRLLLVYGELGNLFKYSKNTHGQKLFEKLSLLL